MIGEILVSFGTLFAIVNPFSTSLIFNKLTTGLSKSQKNRIALQACVAALFTLVIFLFLGQYVLSFFGITIYAFRVAGGVYLAWIGFEMLSPHPRKKSENYTADRENIAIIPLAIPLLSGPGALTSVLVQTADVSYMSLIISIILVCLVSFVVLYNAPFIQQLLGRTGANVLERLMGIIVLVVAVQFVFNGITGYLASIGIGL